VTVRIALLLCAALTLAGCSSATDSATSTPTTSAEPATSMSVGPVCADVADKARGLATEVGRLTTGQATVDQVRASANELSTAFADARDMVGSETRAHLDEAGQALQRMQDALNAQPIDRAGLRAAADDLVTALGDAATVCASESSTDSAAPTS
jgi:PBP1b-binding outer membrane lipoprotein LpoB